MTAPVARGGILARSEAILTAAGPDLARGMKAVAFESDTGRLGVAPAYGTTPHWSTPNPVAAASEKARGANVRTQHGLAATPTKGRLRHGAHRPAGRPGGASHPDRRPPPRD
ncbi:hypothetical protein [Streptomyces sp. NPDC046976]|uniref:hypothetical protein n=1 Tax=Streptomyces sp. NPDC046976 TaxID=3155258 RepID=UPI0033E52F04